MGDIANNDHFQHRINKFARGNAGQEGEYQAAHARDVSISNLAWRKNKYVIPLRFLHYFFAVTKKKWASVVTLNSTSKQTIKNF